MGRIVFPRAELAGTLSELVGYKAGLALDQELIASHIDEEYRDLIVGDGDAIITVRSEEAEEIVSQLLFGVGNTPVRHRVNATAEVLRRLRRKPRGTELLTSFQQILLAEFKRQEDGTGPFDFTPVLDRCMKELGPEGAEVALMWFEAQTVSMQQNPWSRIRRVHWTDTANLRDLFESEAINAPDGGFIDQRFLDYLARNVGGIDAMNWRKFEALTGEFFKRAGYHVEIGEGRNDGGIDIRLWPNEPSQGDPPTMLIQCKRQRQKVGKVIVKALWADLIDEGAAQGLIVTTSSLSPGAAAVCEARGYPVGQADRESVVQWLELMRSPHTGVFLGL